MVRRIRSRDRDLNNPKRYPARYEADWRRRRSRRTVVRTAIVVIAFALFAWPLGWKGAALVAALAGCVHFLYVWRRHRIATAWDHDGYAERHSVRALRPLNHHGYVTLHDLHHGDVRLQTLLIGTTGVWLVHAVGRSPQRRIWGDAAYLHPDRRPVPPDPEELRDRAHGVAEALGAELGEPIRVRPVFMVIGHDVPEVLLGSDEVPVVQSDHLAARVQTEPDALSRADVARVAEAATAAFSAEAPSGDDPDIPPMAVKKSLWAKGKGPEFVRETEIGRAPDGDEEHRT